MRYLTLAFLGMLILGSCTKPSDQWELFSPDGQIRITVSLDNENGCLSYEAALRNDGAFQVLLEPSPLGLITDRADLSRGLKPVSEPFIAEIDEKYEMISGKQGHFYNHANEICLTFTQSPGNELVLRMRAYDDGMAFRYELTGDEGDSVTVERENTGFRIPGNSITWIPVYDTASGTTPAYETLYTNGTPAGQDAPRYSGWSFPALFKTGESWMLISETNVYDYCGAHLDSAVENGTYMIRFPEIDERFHQGPSSPTVSLPMETPWRYVLMGSDLNTIVKSGMAYHLADPCVIEDTGWIKPGRASWSWWSSTGGGRNLEILQDFTDLASEMSWEYTLVDAGWERMSGGSLEDLLAYAAQKDVGVWIWYNSGGRRRSGNTEPGIMEDPQRRRDEFRRIHELGVKGVKIDFFNSDKQHIIKLYQDILADAADYRLLVNFHGCTLPRGWRRTYPNLLSMEAIKGGENYRYDAAFPENASWMNTIAFLVRNSAGPMDYTPVMLSDQKFAHRTTKGHELATAVLFESGITHFADRTSAYRSLPADVKHFLSGVPVTWEAIELVDAIPGAYALAARRAADQRWFLAGINGKNEDLTLSFTPGFLPEGKQWSALVISDQDSSSLLTERMEVSRDSAAMITLKPYGGFVWVIEEQDKK